MLFNSVTFILVFLPLAWLTFIALARVKYQYALAWLCLASLAFYGYSSLSFLAIMLCSVIANFTLAKALLGASRKATRRLLLTLGVVGNLLVIGYFKYVNFFIDNIVNAFGFDFFVQVALPLGISFYTFQKIALLVDIYRGEVENVKLLEYLLFISFFPQLIAGPIVHYNEIVPQLVPAKRDRLEDLMVGSAIFIIGLFKKVVVADSIAQPSNRFFAGVGGGATPEFGEAWLAALCYALQIYYDFSAYSDMAIGLGRMFGINLPINFASPYKARSIIDFWRRWHITLSRLLRDYVYIPLGGGRSGSSRRSANVMMTMLIGGVWHGAAWAFVAWGALHGAYLLVNHLWLTTMLSSRLAGSWAWAVIASSLTLLCVVFAWVPFRTGDLGIAITIWKAMLGLDAVQLSATVSPALGTASVGDASLIGPRGAIAAIVLIAATLVLPNSCEIMARACLGTPTSGYPATYLNGVGWLRWEPSRIWAVLLGAVFGIVMVKLNEASEFIYFSF